MNKQKPPNVKVKEDDPEKQTEEEKLGQTDLSNVNARDFNFLSFEEIYNRLHNITTTQKGPNLRAVLLRESSTKYIMPYCHFIGGNYWILKTTYQNQGHGIHVFKSISQLISIILSYVKGEKQEKETKDKGLKQPLFSPVTTES